MSPSPIDVLRIFHALKRRCAEMRPAIQAVRNTCTAIAEVALSYTVNLSSPSEKLHTLATTSSSPSGS